MPLGGPEARLAAASIRASLTCRGWYQKRSTGRATADACYRIVLVRFRRTSLVTALLLLAVLIASPRAHDVPADTTVRMFIKPEGFTLRVLARVQMASINDVDWPMLKPSGYLDLPKIEPFLKDAGTMWISDYMDVYENGRKLGPPDVSSVRIVPEGDQSFNTTYDAAVAHMRGEKIPPDTTLFPLQGFLEVMFDYKINSPLSSFAINPRFDRLGLRVTTDLQFTRANGAVRSFEYVGLPGLLRLDPSTTDAVARFLQLGFFHVLGDADTLLFLLALVIPLRKTRLSPIVGIFAVAVSITFFAVAAFRMAPDEFWFDPFIALTLAVAIVYASIENILGAKIERRWIVALVFGLPFGASFATSLKPTLQFAGSHPAISMLAFDTGAAVALFVVAGLMSAAVALLFAWVAEERMGTIVLSAIVAHSAWHSMASRYADFRRYPIRWPAFDLMLVASLLRWMMAAVAIAAAVWAYRTFVVARATGDMRRARLEEPRREARAD